MGRSGALTRFLRRRISDDGEAAKAAGQGAAAIPVSEWSAALQFDRFITIHAEKKPNAVQAPSPGEPEPDSDDPEQTVSSNDLSQPCVSARNIRFFTKHQCKAAASSQETGNGLFSVEGADAGTELPVKGPWFRTEAETRAFLSTLAPETAHMLTHRIVRLDVQSSATSDADEGGEDEGGESAQKMPAGTTHLFKVTTNPTGFVNHFTKLSTQPNCELVYKEGAPLGEHSLVVKATKKIKAGMQWLLNYGPLHPLGRQTQRKVRRPRSSAPGAEEAGQEEGQPTQPRQKRSRRRGAN